MLPDVPQMSAGSFDVSAFAMRLPWLQISREWRPAAADSTAELTRALGGTRGHYIVYDRPLPSRLQDGPTCGLCALSIAARSLQHAGALPDNVKDESDIAAMVEAARAAGASNNGEMFVADHLADLARSFYGLQASVKAADPAVMIDRLSKGDLILIAYDRDSNNSPRQTSGANAHWALIRGMSMLVDFLLLIFSNRLGRLRGRRR